MMCVPPSVISEMNEKSFKTPQERQQLLFKDTRGSTGVGDYKSRKEVKAKKANEKGIGKEGNFDMSFIEQEKVSDSSTSSDPSIPLLFSNSSLSSSLCRAVTQWKKISMRIDYFV
jgi:hypothetical protein